MIQGTTQSKPKTVLIIGAGFLGGHIAVPLLKSGFVVTMLDWSFMQMTLAYQICKNSGAPEGNLQTKYKSEFDFSGSEMIVHGEMPDVIINCVSGRLHCKESYGFRKLIEYDAFIHARSLAFACEEKTQQIILFSSDAVYGDKIPGIPAEEYDSTLRPSSYVGHVMHMMERTLLEWSQKTEKIATIFRPSNIYGHLNDNGVVANFFEKALQRQSGVIFGDGSDVRDYVYIEDVVRMTEQAVINQTQGIYNASTGIETTTDELEQMIVGITKVTKGRKYEEYPKNRKKIGYSCLNATIARMRMRVPVMPLLEGLEITFQKMKS